MTSQEKKKELINYSKIEKRIAELRDEIDCLWDTTASILPNAVRGGNGDGNKVERTYERIEKVTKLLEEEIDKLLLFEYKITKAIQTLPDINERRVLTLAYIGKVVPARNGKTLIHKRMALYNIAKELSYSYDRIKHIHGDALAHIDL